MHKQYATNGLPKYYKQIIIMQYSRNEIHCEHSANTQLPPTKHATNTPSGVGANSSRPYPYIIKYVYSFHKIRTFVPSYIHFRTTFRGCIRICGHDKSAPTAAYKLPKYCEQIKITQHSRNEIHNEHPANTQLPPTKLATNTPSGVGTDSLCPYFCFTTLTLFCFHVHIFVQPYSYTLIIVHAFSFSIVGIISNTLIFYLNSKRTI